MLAGEGFDMDISDSKSSWLELEPKGEGCFNKWCKLKVWKWVFVLLNQNPEVWATCIALVENLTA